MTKKITVSFLVFTTIFEMGTLYHELTVKSTSKMTRLPAAGIVPHGSAVSTLDATSPEPGPVVVNVGNLSDDTRDGTRNPGQFKVPDLHVGDRVELRWVSNSNTKYYGDVAEICLHAFDTQGTLVHARLSEGLCVYGGYWMYMDMQSTGFLATTTVSGERYVISVEPKKWESLFAATPASYKLSIFVEDMLPSEGRSEWAGLISSMTSNLFTVK